MTNIYCISGLGADQRAFGKLSIPGAVLKPVDWVAFDKHDGISCYAQKMAATIPEDNPTILGLSFGGMVAAEIAKIRPVKQVFLVSSAKDATELPPVSNLVKFLAHARLLPVFIMKIPSNQVYNRFGVETEEEKALLMDILKKTDNSFSSWAARAMIDWHCTAHADNIIHIHGTADQMIVPQHIHPTHWVEGGTHFMIYRRADEVSRLIAQHLG